MTSRARRGPTRLSIPIIRCAYQRGGALVQVPVTPGGYNGAGETGTVGPLSCRTNAVEDALRPLGIAAHRLPLSPYNLWAPIQAAEGGSAAP